jgi:elongation factor P
MSLLEYNEVTERKYIVLDGEPYEVVSSHIFRMQQRKPQNVAKLKNLGTGKVREHTFHQSDKVPEAEIEKRDMKFIYANRGQYVFSEPENPSKRVTLTEDQVGDGRKFLKPNEIVIMLMFGERMLGVVLPVKVELKVVEAAPAVKGNTVSGGSKMVKLESGAEVQVPLFINEGEIIRINTESGEYVERA